MQRPASAGMGVRYALTSDHHTSNPCACEPCDDQLKEFIQYRHGMWLKGTKQQRKAYSVPLRKSSTLTSDPPRTRMMLSATSPKSNSTSPETNSMGVRYEPSFFAIALDDLPAAGCSAALPDAPPVWPVSAVCIATRSSSRSVRPSRSSTRPLAAATCTPRLCLPQHAQHTHGVLCHALRAPHCPFARWVRLKRPHDVPHHA